MSICNNVRLTFVRLINIQDLKTNLALESVIELAGNHPELFVVIIFIEV